MSLSFALLGFINYGPKTGYELKKHLGASTAYFWHAELAQIYPTLKHLASAGLITSTVEPQTGKPDKRIYSITEAGRAAFESWLRQPLDEPPQKKDAVLLQLFFSGALDKETLLDQLRRQLAAHRARLECFSSETRSTIQEIVAQTGMQREGVMWDLIRQHGVGYEEHYVRWLEHAIQTVEKSMLDQGETNEN